MDGVARSLGILYAEDFDDLPPQPQPEPPPHEPPPPEPPAPPPITQSDIDAACKAAVLEAHASWARSAQQHHADALATLATTLAGLAATATAHAEAAAEAVARTTLATLAALLPDLCRTHGDNEVRALARRLLPLLAARAPVTLRVHPNLIDLIRADLATLADPIAINVDLRPANLPPGDLRLAWDDGSLTRDTAAIQSAVLAALSQFGLLPKPTPTPAPTPAHEPRSLALAH